MGSRDRRSVGSPGRGAVPVSQGRVFVEGPAAAESRGGPAALWAGAGRGADGIARPRRAAWLWTRP